MTDEIKNTVYIGIACSLLALVLTFVASMTGIRDSMAKARNEEVVSREQLAKYQQYNAYDNKYITGMQLIRLITESASKDIDIYIEGITDTEDKDGNGVADTQLFNNALFIKNPTIYKINTYGESSDISNSWLALMYANTSDKASKAKYYTYIVYDSENVVTTPSREYSGTSTVTGIHVKYIP